MGCIVEHGGFYIEYDGVEDEKNIDLNNRIQDYYEKRTFKSLTLSDREQSLVTFFLQLSRYLQQTIGTVAAIDFKSYADQLNYQLDEDL